MPSKGGGLIAFLMLGQDVRDLLADHWMETIETDLKHTVLLVCEEVTDLRMASERQQGEATPDTLAEMPFLAGTEDFCRLRCRLSEGDSIPRSDSALLRVPVSQREVDKEKRSAKKAIKMKIKKFKKSGNGARASISRTNLSPKLQWSNVFGAPLQTA